MPIRQAVHQSAVIALLTVIMAGCASTDSPGPQGPGPGTSLPPPVPAPDCTSSTLQLPDAAGAPGVTFRLKTDPTHTSLLMTNTGHLTAVVFPDAEATTRLTTSPHVNPPDPASSLALQTVADSGSAARAPGVPAGVTSFVVPPGWSVCALSDVLTVPARTRYLQDKTSSVQYELTKKVADRALAYITPAQLKRSNALLTCARGGEQAVQGYPDLQGVDLALTVIGDGSACHTAVKMLLSQDDRATRSVTTRVITYFERVPTFVSTSKLLLALAR